MSGQMNIIYVQRWRSYWGPYQRGTSLKRERKEIVFWVREGGETGCKIEKMIIILWKKMDLSFCSFGKKNEGSSFVFEIRV